MQSDADRFRPRDDGRSAEQSSPTAGPAGDPSSVPGAASAFGASYDDRSPAAEPQQRPEQGASPQPAPRRSRPQPPIGTQPPAVMQPPQSSPHAAPPPIGAQPPPAMQPPQSSPHAAPPAMYAMPPTVTPHFATSFDGRDAPLIHPAAAQASNATPYGVPVYRAPAYLAPPQPQRGLSITALVLGLCSMLFAWTLVVVPILGIVFGFLALRREPAGRVMAIVGLIGSGVGLLLVLLLYLLPLLAVLAALVFATGP